MNTMSFNRRRTFKEELEASHATLAEVAPWARLAIGWARMGVLNSPIPPDVLSGILQKEVNPIAGCLDGMSVTPASVAVSASVAVAATVAVALGAATLRDPSRL